MISAHHLPSVCGVLNAERCSRNVKLISGNCRAAQQGIQGLLQPSVGDLRSSGSSNSSRRLVSCQAEPEPVGGYTPADYITFSEDESKQCHHNAEVLVDAPLELCYSLWSDWTKLLDFLDLVGQIGLDNGNPHMALFQCFYRFRKLPLMEIVFLLERQEQPSAEGSRSITFNSVYGMPMKGQLRLSEVPDGQTRVQLYFTHPVPNLLVQMQIGPFGVETDMMQILRENMAAYKAQVEALVTEDWQQQKQEVVERVQQQLRERYHQQQQQREQLRAEQEQAAEPQPQPQQRQQQEQQQQHNLQQQAEQQQQPQEQQPAAAAGHVQHQQQQQPPSRAATRQRGRTTASKASAAAPAAEATQPLAAPAQQEEAAAAAAAAAAAGRAPAGLKAPARGRKTTRGRSASKAAVAGMDENSSSSSSAASKRRSRMSSSAGETAGMTASGEPSTNGTGKAQQGSSSSSSSSGDGSNGKGSGRRSTSRRTSKRASTAGKE